MTASSFQFIVSSDPNIPNDDGTKALVRRKAAVLGAAGRKKRSKRQKEHEQSTTTTDISTGVTSISTSVERDYRDLRNIASVTPSSSAGGRNNRNGQYEHRTTIILREPLQTTAYENARSKYGACITQLSVLTQWNLGPMTVYTLEKDPTQLQIVLNSSRWSYLQFVPQYYGLNDCLTSATDCLMYRMQKILTGRRGERLTRAEARLNSKALQSLQLALSDAEMCLQSETLCASQLLCLCELLEPISAESWTHHVTGTAKIIQHRGPASFRDEFDLALLAANVAPMVADAVIERSRSYLEAPEWMDCYRAIGQEKEETTIRSKLILRIRGLMIILPGLYRDTEDALRDITLGMDHDVAALYARCEHAHQSCIDCIEALELQQQKDTSPEGQHILRENHGIALSFLMVVKRLLSTFSQSSEHQRQLETEAQAIATSVLSNDALPPSKYSFLAAAYEYGIALSVLATGHAWLVDSKLQGFTRQLALSARYAEWIAMLSKGYVLDMASQDSIAAFTSVTPAMDVSELIEDSLLDLD